MANPESAQNGKTADEEVKHLKTHLDAIEKARNLEKYARARLQAEGLTSTEQEKWAVILAAVSSTIGRIEDNLSKVLCRVDLALRSPEEIRMARITELLQSEDKIQVLERLMAVPKQEQQPAPVGAPEGTPGVKTIAPPDLRQQSNGAAGHSKPK